MAWEPDSQFGRNIDHIFARAREEASDRESSAIESLNARLAAQGTLRGGHAIVQREDIALEFFSAQVRRTLQETLEQFRAVYREVPAEAVHWKGHRA